ncbi:class I SAM-dependent RNA methyltransferase [Arcanobacterium phocisimile]|uniref:Class I SAM-dependent RNA methyltransferase n=1 Tax=Arcanobacterium phocisimile TaxID=1302235 RepID=A0ABX7IL98_9ACTO|nr:TRAM domain-containing protein [Arcanobacterium phocisimile]QRV02885.1 class I SAM-dependent RNA methyltransferase [Arcanobacterium phocisimile]
MSTLRIEITDIAHGGLGVGRDDNRVVFVRGALPGETVDVELTKERSKWARGVVADVVVPSPYRVPVAWMEGSALVTGAADFSHAELSYQRQLKTNVLTSAIRRVGGSEITEHLAEVNISPEISAVDATDGWHTRTRADLVKLPQGFGMHREQSHDIVPISELPIVVPDLEEMIFELDWDRTFKPGKRVRFVAPSTGENIAISDGKAYSAPGRRADNDILETVASHSEFFDYHVAADGFWQVHFRAPGVLQREVLSHANVQHGDSVLELFSGAGLFSVPLAKATGSTGKLLGIEGSSRAVADALKNLGGMKWATARAEQIKDDLPVGTADVIVADPPRNGLGVELATNIASSDARSIVLVSCDPASAARDVAAMLKAGRKVQSMNGFDIFPHTHHLEVVTSLA